MNVITTPSLKQNNVLTTKYFRSDTVYANHLKTSEGKVVDVSSITNNTDFSELTNKVNLINLDLTNIHTSIQSNTSDISSIKTDLTEITTQLNNLSIDFQTDIYLPLYQSSNEINRMSALTEYISTESISNRVNFVHDPFCAVVNFNVGTDLNVSYMTKLYFSNLVNNTFSERFTELKNIYIADVYFMRINNTTEFPVYEGSPYFHINLNMNELNAVTSVIDNFDIHVPDTILNLNDGLMYRCEKLEHVSGSTQLNNSNLMNMKLIIRNCNIIDIDIIYFLFNQTWSESNLTVCFLSNFILRQYYGTSGVVKIKNLFSVIQSDIFYYMRLKPTNFYILAKTGSTVNWSLIAGRLFPAQDGKCCVNLMKIKINSLDPVTYANTAPTNTTELTFDDRSVYYKFYNQLLNFI